MRLDGQPVDSLPLDDRGLAYGDGLFETILLHHARPVFLQRHLNRLTLGCERLGITLDLKRLEQEIADYSHSFTTRGVLKIIVTRGSGGRGYRVSPGMGARHILSLHPLPAPAHGPDGIATFLCRQRLARQPSLAGIKHLNRLEQVLASLEWPADALVHEGLMLDTEGLVIEGTRSNLFLVEQGRLLTPSLDLCGVNGIMREVLLESFGAEAEISGITLERLLAATEVFVCNSVFGVWPVVRLHLPEGSQHYMAGEFTRRAADVFENALSLHEK